MEELTEELLSFYNLSEKINNLTKKEKKKKKGKIGDFAANLELVFSEL